MNKFRFKALIVMTLVAVTMTAAPKKKSILSLKESITDEAIVYPYSFEINTQEMQKNWYLQNYAVVDANVEKKAPNEVSDAEYIQRLRAIPSGIELPFNQVVKAYITRYITKERTMVSQILGMTPYYMPIFERALEKEGLPHELKFIPIVESALDPNVVSSAGAAGLWQFMVDTSKGLGLEVNSLVDERRDPYRSSNAAASYFKQLYGIYGDWSLAIAAYNCGPANVNKALRRAKNKDNEKPDFWSIYEYLPRETRGYVPAFIAATYVMNNYQKHNINPALSKKPLIIDTVMVSHRVNFNQISSVLNIPIEEIRILNPQYRHDIIPGDTHPYSLALPSQQIYSYIMVEDSIMSYRKDLYATRDVVEPGNRKSSVAQQMVNPKDAEKNVVKQAKAEDKTKAQSKTSTAPAIASNETGESKYHKVKRGETIESIAENYNMSVAELMALNSLNRKHVSRGQVLKVTGESSVQAEKQKPEPTYASAQPKKEVAKKEPAPKKEPKAETKAPARSKSYSVNDEIGMPRTTTTPKKQKQDAATPKQAASESSKKPQPKKEEAPAVKTSSSKSQKAAIEEEKATAKAKADKRNTRRTAEEESASAPSKKSRKADSATEEKQTSPKSRKAAPSKATDKDEVKSTRRSKKAKAGSDEEKQTSKRKSRKANTDSASKSRKKKAKKEEDATPSSHSVRDGESLERIAHRYGLGTDQLRKANPQLKDADMLHPGDKLKIPKASKKKKSAKEETATKKKRRK